MTVTILTADLAELAGPIREDTGKAGIRQGGVVGVTAAIEAATNGPAAVEAVFGVRVHAERLLRLERVGRGNLGGCAPEQFGAEEEGVVDGAAQWLPAERGVGSIEIGEKPGGIGSQLSRVVVAARVRDAEIEVGGFGEVAVGAEMADDAQILAARCGVKAVRVSPKDLSRTFGKPFFGRGKETSQRDSGIVDAVFAADQIIGDERPINVLKSVVVNRVDFAELGAHFADFEKKAGGERSERDVGFLDVDARLAEREESIGASIRINDGLHAD